MSLNAKRKTPNNSIFHIRLNSNAGEKIDLKDPIFLKVLQQQYAAKYLESMGVETSSKNITKILKQRPLNTCEIVESRMAGGLHTDTITIITKTQKNPLDDPNSQNQTVSNEMLKILDLKKMALRKQIKTNDKKQIYTSKSFNKQKVSESDEQQSLRHLNFNIKQIKARYIFPFNENFTRKNNYKLKDMSNLDQINSSEKQLVFNLQIYKFPFTQIKLTLNTLKQLQAPITAQYSDVLRFLEGFYQQFPQQIFPVYDTKGKIQKQHININELKNRQKGLKKQVHIIFEKKNIDNMFNLIRSQTNVKFIGVFLHLSYWSVFGGVNPIQIQNSMKKKMYLMIKQTMQYYELQTENRKVWIDLVQPMIILTLKMAVDYFFHEQYPKLFGSEESLKVKAHEIAFDKLLLFVDTLLDQGSINGRFIFLESDIDGPKGNFTKDNKFIRKRIFGTSPALQLILPMPKDGKTRSIMAKNSQSNQKQSGVQRINPHSQQLFSKQENEDDQECREKLLNIALLKIRNRIEQFSGTSSMNPIVSLDDSK